MYVQSSYYDHSATVRRHLLGAQSISPILYRAQNKSFREDALEFSSNDNDSNQGDVFSSSREDSASSSPSLSPPPFKLNFQYGSHADSYFDNSIISSSFSSASSSDSDTLNVHVSFNLQYYTQEIRDRQADFRKFLPAPLSIIDMPIIPLDQFDKKEYAEAQQALCNAVPRTSQSENAVSQMGKQAKRKSHKGRRETLQNVLSSLNCKKKNSSSPDHYQRNSANKANLSIPQPFPKPSNIRFNFKNNEAYAQLSAFSKFDREEFSISLYVELPDEPNHCLCHVQTELAVAGLKAYFCSLEEQALIELLWVHNIRDHIAQLLAHKPYISKFTNLIFLQRYECAVVLSAKASALLRHPKLLFLHSISTVLRINPRKMLILVKDEEWVPKIPDSLDLSTDLPKSRFSLW